MFAIVNYDNFTIVPDVLDASSEMARGLSERFYWGMTRYTPSSFPRAKFGDEFERCAVAPCNYERREDARAPARNRARLEAVIARRGEQQEAACNPARTA